MTVEQKRKRIRAALDAEFADLNTSQTQRDKILMATIGQKPTEADEWTRSHLRVHTQGGENVRVRRKLSLVLVLVLILLCLSVTAVAAGLLINGYFERVAQMEASGSLARWGLNEKMSFVSAMREYDLDVNEADYALMADTEASAEDREAAADRMIQARYGEMICEEVSTWVQQPEDISDVAPNETIIFLERYMAEHPEGIQTKEDYIQYTDALGYYLRDIYYPAFEAETARNVQPDTVDVGTEAYAAQCLVSYMTEVLGWDMTAAANVTPSLLWDEAYQLWVVSGEVSRASMENAFEPVLEGPNIEETETGYQLTMLVDTKGNFSGSSLDKDAFVAEHKNDVEPISKISDDEATRLVKDAVMRKFGINEADLNRLFYDAEFGGIGEENGLLNRYVFHTHYRVDQEKVYGAVINRATSEITAVFSYQEEDLSPMWKLLFFAAEMEQSESWYVRWPLESKLQLLDHLKACGVMESNAIWTAVSPSENQIDDFLAEVCQAPGYPSVINTAVLAEALLGGMEQWSDQDRALYAELNERFRLGGADAMADLHSEAAEIDEASAVDIAKAAFADAWGIDAAAMDGWRFSAQQVHDGFLGRALVYFRVNIALPAEEADKFFGRNAFSYRVMIDGTMMDASMMPEWYSPEQEKALLEEQRLYDNETFRMFDRYAQQHGLLMDYEDFFHWPLEHQKACAEEMRAVIQRKIEENPSYRDPRLLAFAGHAYGVPDASMMTEDEAVSAAWQVVQTSFGLTDLELTYLAPETMLLDVTDEENPFYQIGFSAEEKWVGAQWIDMQPAAYYVVEVSAHSGEALNTYCFTRSDGETGVDAWNRWY